MEAMMLQRRLPRLGTETGLCRRDSLSSSRTRDSGYNSDLDGLSPLDVVGLDQDLLLPPPPHAPDALTSNMIALLKRQGDSETPFSIFPACATSHPAQLVVKPTLDRTKFGLEIVPGSPFEKALEEPLVSNEEEIERWIKDNLPTRDQPKERVSSIVSLSSTSSCEMHTDTDTSEDEQDSEDNEHLSLPRSHLKIIDLIIQKVEINLRYAAYKQCTNNSTSHARSGAIPSADHSSRKPSQSTGSKRKFRASGSPPAEDSSEEGPNKRRRGSAVTMTDDSDTGARFACPFYKHDPDRYRHRRTCPGPGWPTVHRMKEHLYRSHSQPIFCPICYETFKSDKDQLNHVRLQQCTRSAPQHIEGIDRETVWILRKRTTALRLEEDKWRDVYQVLFPDVVEDDIPSPFYDCDSPTEASRRFRRDLLRRVQEELLVEVGHVPGLVEQQLLQRVAGIIRRCENDLLNPTPPTLSPDRRASASSTASSYHATPAAPTPLLVPRQQAENESVGGHLYDSSQYVPDPPVYFTPRTWNEQMFSVGIDWESVFPSGLETQYDGGSECLVEFQAPMWT